MSEYHRHESPPHNGRTHAHGGRWWRRLGHSLGHLVKPHSHDTAGKVDAEMETSAAGIRTLWISLVILLATAAIQTVVVIVSGSVALLGDTVHNAADALTALPLGVAFFLGRRAATRRFTYGFGRAEDLAGILIIAVIAASAIVAAWTAIDRLLNPQNVTNLPAVAVAAVVGFVGNEWVARYRINTGRAIGSAALVADGVHARTDGFASLAVLLGVIGSALGWRYADPIVGLLITAAIAFVLKDTIREVLGRLMDAVDPQLITTAEHILTQQGGVRHVGEVRMRWIGHQLRAETTIVVDNTLTVIAAHHIAVDAEHALLHAIPRLTAAIIHIDPAIRAGDADPHALLAHHRGPLEAAHA